MQLWDYERPRNKLNMAKIGRKIKEAFLALMASKSRVNTDDACPSGRSVSVSFL
jgi:hypothetical protein